MSAPRSPRRSSALAILPPLGAAIGAVFAFGTLIVATRDGQFESLASFGAGAAVAALASAAVGGGTTLAYTTGTGPRQRAVRVVRSVVVLPAIALATALAVVLYSMLGGLEPIGVLAGGFATLASVNAELDASYLRRQLQTGRLFAADTLHRMFALVLILLGVPFALSMAGGAGLRAVMLRAFSAADPSHHGSLRISRSTLGLAYEAKLTGLSILYSLCDRAGALVAPATGPIGVSGGFMAVVSAQQNASGVLLTGLQTTLAARSQQRARLAWANRLDLIFIATGLVAAAVMTFWQQPLVEFLGLGKASDPESYWVAIALLIPAALTSRVFEFRFLAEGSPSKAVVSRALATAVIFATALVALVRSDIALLATGLLLAEVVSLLVSVVMVTRVYLGTRRRRK